MMLVRCDTLEPMAGDQLVVEAFLKTGASLPVITLRKTQPLRMAAPDSTGAPALGAEMTLTLGGQPVRYRAVVGKPGQYAPEQEVVVPARVPYTLDVRWQGRHATASGRTPPSIAVEQVRIDVPREPVDAILVDSLRRDSLDIPAEVGLLYPIEVTLTWSTEFPEVGADSSYWIRTQLKPFTTFTSTVVDFFLQPEEVFREREVARVDGTRRWTGVYAIPVADKEDPLPAHQLRVAVLRSGADYASFATTRDDPERREPISNVEGGLGVVAAIALDTVLVRIDQGSGGGEIRR